MSLEMTVSAHLITPSWSRTPFKHRQVYKHEKGAARSFAAQRAAHRARELDTFGKTRLLFADALKHQR